MAHPICYSIAIRSSKPGTKKENIKETKAYPVIQLTGKMTLKDLATHMEEHNSKYNRGDITAVLIQACDCALEFLKQGFSVEFGDLGRFSPSLKVTGAKTAEDCTVDNIKSVGVNFAKGSGLAALETRSAAGIEFKAVPSRQAQADALAEERSKTTLQDTSGGSGDSGDGHNSMD